ncbi:MAG: hypothetical protein OSJ72_10155 [Lachnospiraceae bacterium]|nr:hypothetical protein [Lachnospiraceae bacterium]
MTIAESLIEWLMEFNEDGKRMERIDVDRQSAEVESYSLIKEPTVNSTKNILGEETVTVHHTLMARLADQTNTDRIENNAFGEAMEDWIEEKNDRRDYPVLTKGKVVEVRVTTPFFIGRTETNNSVYQMTVALKYEKKV